MILFNNLFIDDTIKLKNSVISKILTGSFKKNYFVLLYDFKSTETFDIICTSHLPNLQNKDELVLVGISKTKTGALQHVVQFFQDIIDTNLDIMDFDFDEYIITNSKKE